MAIGSIKDIGRDGTPDSLETALNGLIANSASYENRAIAEYSLSSEVVSGAYLDLSLSSTNANSDLLRSVDLYVSGGDGLVSLGDFQAAGTFIGTVNLQASTSSMDFRFNVTGAVQQVIASGNQIIRLQAISHGDNLPVFLSTPTLSINGVAAARGLRGWETTSNAIRTNGTESFRVEVDAGVAVNGVDIDLVPSWASGLTGTGTGRIHLRDDGLAGDRVAGDLVYTSAEFRYDTSFMGFPDYYDFHPDSVRGIMITDIGDVYFQELDGTESQMLQRPEVGLVQMDIPAATVTQLSSNVQVTPHFINVNTATKVTQNGMRGNQPALSDLTNTIYSVLPDEFDFLNFFSTNHLELSPRLSALNFHAGNHQNVKVDWTGSINPIQDYTSTYGSQGRLLGMNRLDTMSRGIWGANATHELVHQWSASIAQVLGVSEGSHYLNSSSAASLVGGFQWTPNADGSYTIDFDEGRNGATHASPLELYMMGLIDKSQVPDILVYDPVATPKSASNPVVQPNEIIRRVTIDDIIAIHGERTGPVRTNYRIGFVADTQNRLMNATELAFYEQFAAQYTKEIPQGEADPRIEYGWSSISRFFGHGTTWSTLVPGQVEAVNHAPVAQSAVFFVQSNAVGGTIIGNLIASDEDVGQSLQYSIIDWGGSPGLFTIDASGQIRVSPYTNLSTVTQRVMKVRVTDNGVTQQYKTVDVVINVIPNRPPVVSSQSFAIVENSSPNGTVIGSIQASDPDAGQTLSYSIVSTTLPGAFSLTSFSGRLTVANSSLLNYESVKSVTLTVRVSDNGNPALATDATVTIEITDLNENPTMAIQSFTVAENAVNGSIVGTVVASDVDVGQTLSYSISASSLAGVFAINSATGVITVANSALLNFESVSSVTLAVTVSDNGTPTRSTSSPVTIAVTNVNEAPTIANQSFSVVENTANGTAVGTVVASDVDAGQTRTFAILSGNTNGAFAINSATGAITVANVAALDFETTPTFSLAVRVTDNGGPALFSDALVTINLTDVLETLTVGLDVVPGDATNKFKKNAKFDVAILSTATFNAQLVNVSSIRFGKLGTENSLVRNAQGVPTYVYKDVNGDGRLDLVVKIDATKTGLIVGSTLAKFSGVTTGGLQLIGSSAVIVTK